MAVVTWKAARTAVVFTMLAGSMPFAMSSAKAGAAGLEYAVKANYLYKFAAFVTWPPQAFASELAPFTICVAGTDPFGSALAVAVRGQRIGTHPVAIRRMQRVDSVAGCHVLFAGGTRTQTTADMLHAVGRQPVLTVVDEQQGASDSIIRFVVRGGRVRFIINRGAAGEAGVTISSKLLDLAVAVES